MFLSVVTPLPGAQRVWKKGIPQKCHPAVDPRSGYLDTWTTGLGSEKKTTTQER